NEDEIRRMVADAEVHAEEDKKLHELVNTRNQCDAMIHSVKKALAEHGESLDADEKAKIESSLKEAEEAIKGSDKDAIESKTQALATASQKLGEKIYAQQQPAAGEGAHASADPEAAAGSRSKKDDDVVDAEFTEVKDKK
ncbi:MAG: Hsp70 family protein, partial [Candidatus Methylophosphatis roskildensis]